MTHHNPITHRPDKISEPLYVVSPISNPCRYRSRWGLYHDFKHHIENRGAKLHTVEVAYGDREFSLPDAQVKLRTQHELWNKENAINVAVQSLPSDWKYMAWIDADVTFIRPDIVAATLHALQHFDVVQMWSEALDLDPDGHCFATYASFGHSYLKSLLPGAKPRPSEAAIQADAAGGYYPQMMPPGRPAKSGAYWHTGYAWAIRRDAFDAIGGLLDNAIVGAGDYFMAWALIGELGKQGRIKTYHPAFVHSLKTWERNAKVLRKNIGCVEGVMAHHWHGKKRQRGYHSRDNILRKLRDNPYTDLRKDWQGLWQLHDDGSERSIRLRDQLRAYFRSRNEDSVDL